MDPLRAANCITVFETSGSAQATIVGVDFLIRDFPESYTMESSRYFASAASREYCPRACDRRCTGSDDPDSLAVGSNPLYLLVQDIFTIIYTYIESKNK